MTTDAIKFSLVSEGTPAQRLLGAMAKIGAPIPVTVDGKKIGQVHPASLIQIGQDPSLDSFAIGDYDGSVFLKLCDLLVGIELEFNVDEMAKLLVIFDENSVNSDIQAVLVEKIKEYGKYESGWSLLAAMAVVLRNRKIGPTSTEVAEFLQKEFVSEGGWGQGPSQGIKTVLGLTDENFGGLFNTAHGREWLRSICDQTTLNSRPTETELATFIVDQIVKLAKIEYPVTCKGVYDLLAIPHWFFVSPAKGDELIRMLTSLKIPKFAVPVRCLAFHKRIEYVIMYRKQKVDGLATFSFKEDQCAWGNPYHLIELTHDPNDRRCRCDEHIVYSTEVEPQKATATVELSTMVEGKRYTRTRKQVIRIGLGDFNVEQGMAPCMAISVYRKVGKKWVAIRTQWTYTFMKENAADRYYKPMYVQTDGESMTISQTFKIVIHRLYQVKALAPKPRKHTKAKSASYF